MGLEPQLKSEWLRAGGRGCQFGHQRPVQPRDWFAGWFRYEDLGTLPGDFSVNCGTRY